MTRNYSGSKRGREEEDGEKFKGKKEGLGGGGEEEQEEEEDCHWMGLRSSYSRIGII